MKIQRVRITEAAAGIFGLILFVSLFLPWFEIAGRGSVNAWGAFCFSTFVLAVLAGAGIAMPLISASSSKTDVPIATTSATVPLGILGTLLVIYRQFSPVDDGTGQVGLYLGLFACLGLLLSSWRAMADDKVRQPHSGSP